MNEQQLAMAMRDHTPWIKFGGIFGCRSCREPLADPQKKIIHDQWDAFVRHVVDIEGHREFLERVLVEEAEAELEMG